MLAALLLFLMPTVTPYPIDLTNDPQPILIGTGGEFDGPVKIGSALYCWGVITSGAMRVYKSTDNGHTWTGQNTAAETASSPAPAFLDTVGNRLIVGNLVGGFFVLRDYSFSTDTWGSNYGSGSISNSASGQEFRRLSNGNLRFIYRFTSLGLTRLYYAEYSYGSSSWVSTGNLISNENTHNIASSTCSVIDASDTIGVIHQNAFDGNYYYNSINAAGTVSASVNLSALFPNTSLLQDCILDGSALKFFTGVGGAFLLPTVLKGTPLLSPSWTSYLTDADAGDDMRVGYIWRDAAGAVRETWGDYGDHGSLATGHHFAEVADGSTSPTYYDLSGFTSATYVKSMSIGKDGYLLYLSDNHLYFVPPNVSAPRKRNVSYVGAASSMQSAPNFSY